MLSFRQRSVFRCEDVSLRRGCLQTRQPGFVSHQGNVLSTSPDLGMVYTSDSRKILSQNNDQLPGHSVPLDGPSLPPAGHIVSPDQSSVPPAGPSVP